MARTLSADAPILSWLLPMHSGATMTFDAPVPSLPSASGLMAGVSPRAETGATLPASKAAQAWLRGWPQLPTRWQMPFVLDAPPVLGSLSGQRAVISDEVTVIRQLAHARMRGPLDWFRDGWRWNSPLGVLWALGYAAQQRPAFLFSTGRGWQYPLMTLAT
jgi:hypothetical protein